MLEYQKTFLEQHPSWSEKVFVIKKVKNPFTWTYVLSDRNSA